MQRTEAEHACAFMVAGAMKAELLADLGAAVDKSIAGGGTLEEFRRDCRTIVEKNGWHGWTGEGTKGGEAWRTRVIYRANMASEPTVVVQGPAKGRWRIGRKFGPEPTSIPVTDMNEAQFEALMADPDLLVTIVDAPH